MMVSQILKFVDFIKTQKSRYLVNETLFFPQIKKSLITHKELFYIFKFKNIFLVEVTFNHPMIYRICDTKTNISTKDRVRFYVYLLNHNSLTLPIPISDEEKKLS